MPTISVIVPVYKVEAYLDRCVQSILDQTFVDFELILVDDGSPDNCPAMCDAWAAKDSRIKVIHKQNGGLADARNYGIDVARGTYLAFVDSDDYIHPEMLNILFSSAMNYMADIVLCECEEVFDGHTIPTGHPFCKKETVYSGIQIIKNYYEDFFVDSTCRSCNKLFKKDIFDDLRFIVGYNFEDAILAFPLFYRAKKVVWLDVPLYYYYQRPLSITRSNLLAHPSFLLAANLRRKYLKSINMKDVEKKAVRELCLHYIWTYGNIYLLNKSDIRLTQQMHKIRNCLWGFWWDILSNPFLIKIQKVQLLLCMFNSPLAESFFARFFS